MNGTSGVARCGSLAASLGVVIGMLTILPGDGLERPKSVARRDSILEATSSSVSSSGRASPVATSAAWTPDVVRCVAASEYSISSGPDCGLVAPNRRNNLRITLRPERVEVHPRVVEATPWGWSWSTLRWGRTDRLLDVGTRTADHHGREVSFTTNDLSEWYVNRESGLEQGFTLVASPDGAGRLCIEGKIEVSPSLELRLEAEQLVARNRAGVSVLEYRGLQAWDAEHRPLFARLELEGAMLRILVDDRGARYPVTVDPLITSPLATLDGHQANADFGASVVTAGDVNGDGFGDLLVGAPRFDDGQTDEGAVFVYFGSATGPDTTADWSFMGNQVGAGLGTSVAPAGDIDLDGYDDILVGAPGFDGGQTDEGRLYVFMGSSTGPDTTAWTYENNVAGSQLGTSVATARDVNGDQYPDVLVGAPGFDSTFVDEGRAYLFLGSPSGPGALAWIGRVNRTARFGQSLSTAGDLDRDGRADVIVGAPLYDNGQANEGVALIFRGTSTGLTATPAKLLEANQAGARFGRSVAQAGDVDGDGFSDVIVGAPLYQNGQVGEGRAYVFYGDSAQIVITAGPWIVESDQANAHTGGSVATAGDVNGDAYADVVVGTDSLDVGITTNCGSFRVYLGSAFGLATQAVAIVNGTQTNERLGGSVATAGDMDGDGFSDVVAGAIGYSSNFGRVRVYRGTAAPPTTTPGPVLGQGLGQGVGESVANAGDVNGDGFSDVIVGAPGNNSGAGRVMLFLGTAAGLDTVPAWQRDGGPNSSFGHSVASAGDVNGDGYGDVIVGAPAITASPPVSGRAFLYYGTSTGLDVLPAWSAQGTVPFDRFGAAVSGAGDVDGDGFCDIAVGADNDSINGIRGAGRVYLYKGSASGPSLSADWTATSDQTPSPARFGYALANAGDVNDDGLSDLVVGAPGYLVLPGYHGAAFVFHGITDSTLTATPVRRLHGGPFSDFFGSDVSPAGDVNGDRFSDVIVGDPWYGPMATQVAAYVFAGSPAGSDSVPLWRTTINSSLGSTPFEGGAVGTALDVNLDGYSDVVIGASTTDGMVSGAGAAYLFLGSGRDSALGGLPAWADSGDAAQASLGTSVAGADLNGDGFADLVVGAPGNVGFPTTAGRVRAYAGNGAYGRARIPRAFKSDSVHVIGAKGSSDLPDGFQIRSLSPSPAGRDWILLQSYYDVPETAPPVPPACIPPGPLSMPSPGPGIHSCGTTCSGTKGVASNPPSEGTPIHDNPHGRPCDNPHWWLARVVTLSPYFPAGPFLASPLVWGPFEVSLRTFGHGLVSVTAPVITRGIVRLGPSIPNSFRTRTRLHYVLAAQAHVRLTVHDVQGRTVATLVDALQTAGPHSMDWWGADDDRHPIASGVYFARLAIGKEMRTLKIVLAR